MIGREFEAAVSERFTVIGKLASPHLDRPYVRKHHEDQKPYYDATLVLSLENAACVQAAAETHALQTWNDLSGVYMPVRINRFGRWIFYAKSVFQPSLRDSAGRTERADFFDRGQTVQFDVQFCCRWVHAFRRNERVELRGVFANLRGVKLLGGLVRSAEWVV